MTKRPIRETTSRRGKPKPAARGTKRPRAKSARTRRPLGSKSTGSAKAVPFDPGRIVERYVADVLAGRIVSGRFVRMACQRYKHDRKTAAGRGWRFDEAKAREACHFFAGCLRFTKGELAAKPFVPLSRILAGEYIPGQVSNFIPAPFQCFLLWNLFGWVHAVTGYRRFSMLYFTVGRKGGKSELLAALALKLGLLDNPPEPGARVVIAATKKEQAFDLTFTQARQMVEVSPVLQRRARVYQYAISTEERTPQPYSNIKAIGSNSHSSDGFDLSGVIMDELHAWMKQHAKFYDKLTTASGARRQPLVAIGTTAGDDESTLWIGKDALFCNILESAVLNQVEIADQVFVFIARLDEERECPCRKEPTCRDCGGTGTIAGDDIFDEAAWPKANPNFPIAPTLQSLRDLASLAKLDATQRSAFRRYHCNIKASSFDKALPPGLWSRCGTGLSDWREADIVAGGIDVGERDDLASVGLCARFTLPPETKSEPKLPAELKTLGDAVQVIAAAAKKKDPAPRYRFEFRSHSWSPAAGGKRDITREPWKTWHDKGLLSISEGGTIDLEQMQAEIIALGKQYKVKAFRGDPWNTLQMLGNVEKAGFDCVEHRQNYGMFNEPIREFIRAVKDGRVSFDAASEPILTWAIANLIIRKNNRGEYMPDKGRSPDKIDPAVAILMAFAEAFYFRGSRNQARPYSGAGTGIWG